MPTLADLLRQGSWNSDSNDTKSQLVNALRGAAETGVTLGTGALAGLAGMPYGVYKGITSGAYGTPEAPRIAAREAQQFMERNTYQPRTKQGQEYVQKLGRLFEESKLPPVMPEAAALSAIPKQAYVAQAERAGMAAEKALEPAIMRTMERGGKPAQLLTDLSQGSIRPMDVWHGSPYGPFQKFDPSKARTGEGNASYGEGAYLAQARGTGEQYKEALSKMNPTFKVGNETISYIQNAQTPAEKAKNYLYENAQTALVEKSGKTTAKEILDDSWMDAGYAFSGNELKAVRDEIAKLIESKGEKTLTQSSGYLYKVDLPDEAIPKMIDWDKPLGKQSKEVQQAIEKTKSMLPPNAVEDLGGDLSLLYGKDVTPEQFLNTWESFGQKAGGENALASQGITGVRYLDQESRNAGQFTITPPTETVSGKWMVKGTDYNSKGMHFDTEAEAIAKLQEMNANNTSNFVVFPKYQDLLTIKEINDKPLGAYK
jgi:hypothetical protein